MKKYFVLLLLSFSLLVPTGLLAQSSNRGFEFGLNFGVYKASKYSANYYNGSEKNQNNTKWVMTNNVFYDTIFLRLNAIDTVYVQDDGWPTNMHYKLSVMPGLYGQYTFNDQYALYFDFNYTKLTTQDALILTTPLPYGAFPKQYLCPIKGQEERIYFDIGIRRNIPVSEQISYFLIGGLSVNNTTVVKSAFYVDEKEFSIINNYINGTYVGPNAQTFNVKQGGIGWGLYFSGGVSLHFGNMILEPGINAHFVNVALDGYKKYRPGAGVYFRINLNNFLFGGEE
jgi:hypothetical protein